MRIRTVFSGGAAILAASASLALAQVEGVPQSADAQIVRVQDGGGETRGPVTNLPVPRYVSLKSDHVNVRAGPTKDNDVAWVYTRSGLPVEITAEFENWRRVRDSEGAEGWVYHSLLSGRRTAVVTMKNKDDLA